MDIKIGKTAYFQMDKNENYELNTTDDYQELLTLHIKQPLDFIFFSKVYRHDIKRI